MSVSVEARHLKSSETILLSVT